MSQKSPAVYESVPLSGRSAGVASLRLPFFMLQQQFVRYFAKKTLKYVARGQSLDDVRGYLLDAGFFPSSLAMEDALVGHEPTPVKFDLSWASIDKIRQSATDLCDEGGLWREHRSTIRDAIRSQCESILSSLRMLLATTLQTCGQSAALQVVAEFRKQLRQGQQDQLSLDLEVRQEDVRKLKQYTTLARNLEKKCGVVAKTMRQYSPKRSISFFLSQVSKKNLQTLVKLADTIQSGRYEMLCREEKLRAFEHLLGRNGEPGALSQVESGILEQQQTFQRVLDFLQSDIQSLKSRKASAIVIDLLDDLNQTLDLDGGETVAQFLLQISARAGCTPKRVAAFIMKDGIRLGKEMRRPADWSSFNPSEIVRVLTTLVKRILGCADDDVVLHPEEPVTPSDHMAQLTLLHPVLTRRLQHAVSQVAERSRPFANFGNLSGVIENVHPFLYCFPKDRAEWREVFIGKLTFDEIEHADAYAMPHPYEVSVLQIQVAASIGAMPEYHRACAAACLAERTGKIPSHIDRQQLPEQRYLRNRVRTIEDCEAVFKAGRIIDAIRIVTQDKFTLNRKDSRIDSVFAPRLWDMAELSAETLYHLLRNDVRFSSFLMRLFPDQYDLSDELRVLKKDDSALALVNELVSRKILIDIGGRYRVNATFSGPPMGAPRAMVTSKRGPLTGLTEQEFVSELFRNDQLYCILFFAVKDAYLLGHLSQNQTPPSAVEFARSLI